MPRPSRKAAPRGFMGMLEEVVENGLQGAAEAARDVARDVARNVVTDYGQRQARRVIGTPQVGRFACTTCRTEGAMTPTDLQCTGCSRAFCARHAEYVSADPVTAQCLCPQCTTFMWNAADVAIKAMGQKRGATHSAHSSAGRGAPPQPQKPTASDKDWQLLGLRPNATLDEIQKAKKKLQREYHPDRFPASRRAEAEERFKQVGEAAARCAATWQ